MKPIIGLLAALTIAGTANAQGIRPMPYQLMCGPTAEFEKHVKKKFDEKVVGHGVAHGGRSLVEIYANESTGSFTITMSKPDGSVICVFVGGEGWDSGRGRGA